VPWFDLIRQKHTFTAQEVTFCMQHLFPRATPALIGSCTTISTLTLHILHFEVGHTAPLAFSHQHIVEVAVASTGEHANGSGGPWAHLATHQQRRILGWELTLHLCNAAKQSRTCNRVE
jgi:hypothetical protein